MTDALLHEPSVADDDRLACQCVGRERREEQRRFRYVFYGSELPVHRFLQHHLPDHLLLGDSERLGLLWDLLVDERRAHKAGTDDIGAHAVFRTFLGHHFGEPDQSVLSRDVRRFESRGLF